LASFIGTSCGITIGYLLGRTFEIVVLEKYSDKIHLNPEHVKAAEEFYNRYGKFALFIGYFIPGVRHFTAIFAGASLMPYRIFALFAYTGGFIWTTTFVNFGYLLGRKWHRIYMYSHRYIIPIVLTLIIFLIIGVYLKTKNKKNQLS
jgi:membrane protein DedA with SNARE-associated domain